MLGCFGYFRRELQLLTWRASSYATVPTKMKDICNASAMASARWYLARCEDSYLGLISVVTLVQVAVPDVVEATNGADILMFVLPHQFVERICEQIAGQIKPGTFGISLIKVSCRLHKTQSVRTK